MKSTNLIQKTKPQRRTSIGLLAALTFAGSFAQAAQVALRLADKVEDPVVGEYRANRNGFPITKANLDYLCFNGPVIYSSATPGTLSLFLTHTALPEFFSGEVDRAPNIGNFTGNEVVAAIKAYEDKFWDVKNVLIYREDWLHRGGKGGPYTEDRRVLSPTDLARVRTAIANSTLRCKSYVKLIQLFYRDSWRNVQNNPALLDHLRNFDGLGVETHVGDHVDRPTILQSMAEVIAWTRSQTRATTALIFIGGTQFSYTQFNEHAATCNDLWSRMSALGVAKNADNLIYFRQGARFGVSAKQVPESANTLTRQMAWLIGQVKN